MVSVQQFMSVNEWRIHAKWLCWWQEGPGSSKKGTKYQILCISKKKGKKEQHLNGSDIIDICSTQNQVI